MENIVSLHILKPGLDIIFSSKSRSVRFLLQGLTLGLAAQPPGAQLTDGMWTWKLSSAPFQSTGRPGVLVPGTSQTTPPPLLLEQPSASVPRRTLFYSPEHSLDTHTHRAQAHAHTGACTHAHRHRQA